MSELGPGVSAYELIPGDPEALAELGRALSALASDFSAAASTLQSVDAGSWQGEAANAFRGTIHQQPGKYSDAEWSFSLAGAAVQTYAQELGEAQAQAQRAIGEWESAEGASSRWRAARNTPGVTAPIHDPGQAGRGYAQWQLNSAREQLDGAASRLQSALSRGASNAPRHPSIFHQLFHDVAAIGKQVWHYRAFFELATGLWDPSTLWHFAEGFATGLWDMAKGTVLGIVGLGGFMVAFIRDPRGTIDHTIGTAARVAEYAVEHPVQFAEKIANWDEFQKDPARWLGTIAPAVLLAVATAGAGAVADAAPDLAVAADTAEEAAQWGRIGETADQLQTVGQTVGGLNKVGDVGNLLSDLSQQNTEASVGQSAAMVGGELQGSAVNVVTVPFVDLALP